MNMHAFGNGPAPAPRSRPGARPFVGAARRAAAPTPSTVLAHPVAPPFVSPRASEPVRDDALDVVRRELDEEFAHFGSASLDSHAADVLEAVAQRIRKGEIVVHVTAGWSDAATLAAVLATVLGEAPQAL